MRTFRACGLTLTFAGVGLLAFLIYAVSTRTSFGPNVLIGLGMPVVLLSALAGAIATGLGIWLIGLGRGSHRGTLARR